MFKRFTIAALAATLAFIAVPHASEAGHMKREARAPRAKCAVTEVMTRIARAPRVIAHRIVRPVVVAPLPRVRRERPDWLKRLLAPRVHIARPARAHHHRVRRHR